MARKKLIDYTKEEKQEAIKDLFVLLNELKNDKEFRSILLSLLTTTEIITLSKRLQIAKEVLSGGSYRDIVKKIETGPSAIKTVNLLLAKNDNFLENKLEKYFKVIYKDKKDQYFKKNKLYNYPGYELAAKVLGIEFIDKKLQK